MKRSSGILLPVFSLPSPHGIGTLGAAAREWIDFLAASGQTWWQILPVGPTSYGDSPYQSPSAFAGNPYLIDLDLLVEDGLLTAEEVKAADPKGDAVRIDYARLYKTRLPLLETAALRGLERDAEAVRAFAEAQKDWLGDYALFMAVKSFFGNVSWQAWEDEGIRLHRGEAMARYQKLLGSSVNVQIYIQYLFFRQWDALRSYAAENGIRIIGDLPLYVAMDSADVWASPEYFQLDERNVPTALSGVPPDSFNAEGQFWGNPLYNYDRMAADGYAWWIRRIAGACRLYDAIRIDHFRGLESYWAVPCGEQTAVHGQWIKGPGMELVSVLKENFPDTLFIAEDLGYPTPEVAQLLSASGFPGMHVLQFAFDSNDAGSTPPHRWTRNSICYSGTHDNDTLRGWLHHAGPGDIGRALRYVDMEDTARYAFGIGISVTPENADVSAAEGSPERRFFLEKRFVRRLLCIGMASVCDLFVTQMQDWLMLDESARINAPGTLSGNWQWRMSPGMLTKELAARIREMTERYER